MFERAIRLRWVMTWGGIGLASVVLAGACSAPGPVPEDEVLGSSASAILGDVTLDTAGLVRSVVQVDGCSGVLVGPRVAISWATSLPE